MLMMPPMRMIFGFAADSSRMVFCQKPGAMNGSRPSMINNRANAVNRSRISTIRGVSYSAESRPKYSKKLDVGFRTMTSLLLPKAFP